MGHPDHAHKARKRAPHFLEALDSKVLANVGDHLPDVELSRFLRELSTVRCVKHVNDAIKRSRATLLQKINDSLAISFPKYVLEEEKEVKTRYHLAKCTEFIKLAKELMAAEDFRQLLQTLYLVGPFLWNEDGRRATEEVLPLVEGYPLLKPLFALAFAPTNLATYDMHESLHIWGRKQEMHGRFITQVMDPIRTKAHMLKAYMLGSVNDKGHPILTPHLQLEGVYRKQLRDAQNDHGLRQNFLVVYLLALENQSVFTAFMKKVFKHFRPLRVTSQEVRAVGTWCSKGNSATLLYESTMAKDTRRAFMHMNHFMVPSEDQVTLDPGYWTSWLLHNPGVAMPPMHNGDTGGVCRVGDDPTRLVTWLMRKPCTVPVTLIGIGDTILVLVCDFLDDLILKTFCSTCRYFSPCHKDPQAPTKGGLIRADLLRYRTGVLIEFKALVDTHFKQFLAGIEETLRARITLKQLQLRTASGQCNMFIDYVESLTTADKHRLRLEFAANVLDPISVHVSVLEGYARPDAQQQNAPMLRLVLNGVYTCCERRLTHAGAECQSFLVIHLHNLDRQPMFDAFLSAAFSCICPDRIVSVEGFNGLTRTTWTNAMDDTLDIPIHLRNGTAVIYNGMSNLLADHGPDLVRDVMCRHSRLLYPLWILQKLETSEDPPPTDLVKVAMIDTHGHGGVCDIPDPPAPGVHGGVYERWVSHVSNAGMLLDLTEE
jgi:hypothetical protein